MAQGASTSSLSRDEIARIVSNSQAYSAACVKIQTKTRGLQPLIYNSIQRDLTARRTDRMLILKPRQVGSSTWCLFDRCWYPAVTKPDTNVLVMAHEQDLAEEFLSKMELAHHYLPREFQLQMDEDTKYAKSFPELRSRIDIGTFGVARKGAGARLGRTRQILYGTEIADPRVEDDVIRMAMQIVPAEGVIIFDSTPKGRRGWFFDECMKALLGESDFTLYFYPAYQHEEYQDPVPAKFKVRKDEEYLIKRGVSEGYIVWKRRKVREIGELSFKELYPEDPNECFLFSGSPCFSQTDLEHFANSEGFCRYQWRGKLVEWPRARGSLQRVHAPS